MLEDTVGVDLEVSFDLRSTMRSRWDAVEVKLGEEFGKCTFAVECQDGDGGLVVSHSGECRDF